MSSSADEVGFGSEENTHENSKVVILNDLLSTLNKDRENSSVKQNARGKMSAFERVLAFVDEGSFQSVDDLARHRSYNFDMQKAKPLGDGVVTGYATVDGRPVCVFSQDSTVFGGALGEVFGEKVVKIMDFAIKTGCPIIGFNDSGGARIQEGVASLAMYGEIGRRNVQASGVVPQVSIVLGACAGGATYSPALTDFVIMVDKSSYMVVTGPDVVRSVMSEDVSLEDLGGALTHNTKSGVSHYLASSELDALDYARNILSFLPSNSLSEPPVADIEYSLVLSESDKALDSIVPDSPSKPYDMHSVILALVDDRFFLETQELFARNIITGFGRVEGHSVGFVASQPLHLAGTLDINASEKAARFIRTCDSFNIPVVTIVDSPGFLPGSDQEYAGIIRRGAKLVYAYASCTVPLITVITRKAYGGAYGTLGSKHIGGDLNFAWPTAEIAVMGGEGAVNILYRKELKDSLDENLRSDLVESYNEALVNPFEAANRGYVDAIILPSETRSRVVHALRSLRNKRVTNFPKKHGNIPL